jgi:N-acetyl-anhydromuramyl-L-alanine amidase AmpD
MTLKRIILHWTAGAGRPSALDKEHYHFLVDREGATHNGRYAPEANIRPLRGAYAAHTLNANTGSIGIGLCGMAGAVERPFSAGAAPLTDLQIDAACALARSLCRKYGISVTRETVLTHAEVQPTLGIRQRGKWDISWLPGMAAVGDPVQIGDRLREKIR